MRRVVWFLLGGIPAVVFLLILWMLDARGADDQLCKLYSREMVRAMVRETPAEALPGLTVDQLQYRLTQFWTLCLNRDEPPEIKDLPGDGKWVADLWSEIQRGLPKAEQVGSAPATVTPVVKPASRPTVPAKPAPAKAVQSGDTPQPLCTRYSMKTVYQANGHSWRCQK